MSERTPLRCSFCDKTQYDVRKLIAGRTAFICDECTSLCAVLASSYSVSTDAITRYEAAHLRISAFAALKGWGNVGEDGKWKEWSWADREKKSEALVEWALAVPVVQSTPMCAADLYGETPTQELGGA